LIIQTTNTIFSGWYNSAARRRSINIRKVIGGFNKKISLIKFNGNGKKLFFKLVKFHKIFWTQGRLWRVCRRRRQRRGKQ
jgi:hypothetical protein